MVRGAGPDGQRHARLAHQVKELTRLSSALSERLGDLVQQLESANRAGFTGGFTGVVAVDVERLRAALHHTADLNVKTFRWRGRLVAALLFLEPLVDTRRLGGLVEDLDKFLRQGTAKAALDPAWWRLGDEAETLPGLDEAVMRLLTGHAVLCLEGQRRVWVFEVRSFRQRAVDEPQAERLVRGPRDGFVESVEVNVALIRQRLVTPNLVLRTYRLGDVARTRVCMVYLEGIAPAELVSEVERRLARIRSDAVLDSGQLEQWLEDRPWSPFPQLMETERPDRAVANLLAGRIVLLTDGSPFALVAPALFSQFYQSPEDYYQRWIISTLIRLIRVLSMALALLMPALYIAFVSFHPEMIPTPLAVLLASMRGGVPFPAIGEALLLETAVEILREASIRLPGPIGPAISIVGGLIIGEMTVSAGLVSPAMVIVVAVTTIGSFATPNYSAAIALRILRYPLMLAASVFGLYGVVVGLLLIIVHLADLESFGLPYLYPFTPPRSLKELRDTLVRAPLPAVQRGEGATRP
ncbi:spore germination protein [Thermaerobacter subterraneus]|uniref:Flagellar biosynthesis pathway, component FlhA n=1 Tax=Thermaerobacter subterraneus DSM 13965 TaxID=867903 RepID=K6P3R6_9FIRM|nr:spore germination protein [Thermaerobacter subterraneus]EKP95695.1 flagellar biosynthesis pathway, component FlhA [Thermaerobacter subterraneus DSM 13965]